MPEQSADIRREIPAMKVHQWLPEWEQVPWDAKFYRREPGKYFYIFKLGAKQLKSLTGIHRRSTKEGKPRQKDLGIERRHEKDRSDEIGRFIQYGFPWSTLGERKRTTGGFDNLRKPGWLPTAIVVNILNPEDVRDGVKVDSADLIQITDHPDDTAIIKLPRRFQGSNWTPRKLHPIEVIDGQHRLWAFEDSNIENDFELPVVAFHGLDVAWKAYLFYTINIKPKRINQSLAFDLYPLLRTEDWLEAGEGHSIYRDARAQELTETLWSHPSSPWYHHINMLGEPGLLQMGSQAGWIRSLTATYVRGGATSTRVSGLFAARIGNSVLPWNRAQQGAFLILVGQKLHQSIMKCKETWAQKIREEPSQDSSEDDQAFFGKHSLLSTDQGIRGFLYVTNDLCFVRAEGLKLAEITTGEDAAATDEETVTRALTSFKGQKGLNSYLEDVALSLSKYDWRTSSAAGLTEIQQTQKAAFRGSGGYKMIRQQLLSHISKERGDIGAAAKEVQTALRYK